MGRVRLSKKRKCRTCMALTKEGKLCKRTASCQLGCNLFCWQHAKQHKENEFCVDHNIKQCKRGCDKPQTFPCLKKRTIFRNQQEFDEYCELRRAKRVPPDKRIKRKKRLKLAQKEAEQLALELKGKRRKRRKVRFAI